MSINDSSPADGEPNSGSTGEKPDLFDSFFDQWQTPTAYDPASCPSDSTLQEIAIRRLAKGPHVGNCAHCSSILAALEDANASKEDRLARFMHETRKQAQIQAEKSFRGATFKQGLLARLRASPAFRVGLVGATAVILLALAMMVPNLWQSHQESTKITMPVQDEVKYLMVVDEMQSTETKAAARLPKDQIKSQVNEINRLLLSINVNDLSPVERGHLAQRSRDFQISINRLYHGSTPFVQLAVSDDLATVNAVHESLAALPAGQLEEGKVRVEEFRPNKLVVIKGPFRPEQLQEGSPVYRALETCANAKDKDFDVSGPSATVEIRSAAFTKPREFQ